MALTRAGRIAYNKSHVEERYFATQKYRQVNKDAIALALQVSSRARRKANTELHKLNGIAKIKEYKCLCCNSILPISEFTISLSTNSGYSDSCKKCGAVFHKKTLERNRKKHQNGPDNIREKKCSTCKRVLPTSCFPLTKSTTTGYGNSCKECVVVYHEKALVRNRKKHQNGPDNIMEKGCSFCKRLLPVSSFGLCISTPTGYEYRCNECRRHIRISCRLRKKAGAK